MQLFSEDFRLEMDELSEASIQTLNSSEESVCGVTSISSSESSVEVEILGIELLLAETHLLGEDDDDDSLVSFEVDSLILTRKRLPEIWHGKKGVRTTRKRDRRSSKRNVGEVDSLVLARRRLPHLMRRIKTRASRSREDQNKPATRKSLNHEDEDSDTSSTTSDESTFTFKCGTIDSLIITRERITKKHRIARRNKKGLLRFRPRKYKDDISNQKKEVPTTILDWKRHQAVQHHTRSNEKKIAPRVGLKMDLKMDSKRHLPGHHGSFHDLVRKAKPNTNGVTRAA